MHLRTEPGIYLIYFSGPFNKLLRAELTGSSGRLAVVSLPIGPQGE